MHWDIQKKIQKTVLSNYFWNEGIVSPYNYFLKEIILIWILLVCSIFNKKLKNGVKSKGANIFLISF